MDIAIHCLPDDNTNTIIEDSVYFHFFELPSDLERIPLDRLSRCICPGLVHTWSNWQLQKSQFMPAVSITTCFQWNRHDLRFYRRVHRVTQMVENGLETLAFLRGDKSLDIQTW